jgi:glycogen synthase
LLLEALGNALVAELKKLENQSSLPFDHYMIHIDEEILKIKKKIKKKKKEKKKKRGWFGIRKEKTENKNIKTYSTELSNSKSNPVFSI